MKKASFSLDKPSPSTCIRSVLFFLDEQKQGWGIHSLVPSFFWHHSNYHSHVDGREILSLCTMHSRPHMCTDRGPLGPAVVAQGTGSRAEGQACTCRRSLSVIIWHCLLWAAPPHGPPLFFMLSSESLGHSFLHRYIPSGHQWALPPFSLRRHLGCCWHTDAIQPLCL